MSYRAKEAPSAPLRREFLKRLASVSVLLPASTAALARAESPTHEFALPADWPKIDVHTHISTDADYLRAVMDAFALKMLTICNEALKEDRLAAQLASAPALARAYPRYYGWCTTFGFERFEDADWPERVVADLERDFSNGAVAVKVWKEVGMQLRDADGRYVQIDDPIFHPILAYIAERGKTLFAHIGDPVDLWLSVDEAGRRNGWYSDDGGVWNRIGPFRGEVSYDTLMLARDRLLEHHPDLRVVGCHLGSMAYDVDLVADRLERFPNFAVEISSTLPDLQAQAREKVRAFFLAYQDRVLYGSDISGGLIPTPYLVDMTRFTERMGPAEIEQEKDALRRRYDADFAYLASEAEIDRRNFHARGLGLPEDVMRKITFENAVRWVPGIERGFP